MNNENIEKLIRQAEEISEEKIAFKRSIEGKARNVKKSLYENKFGDYLKTLKYEDAIKTLGSVWSVLESRNINELKRDVIDRIKLRDYPALKKAYRFPVLNDIDFLLEKEIREIDDTLAKIYNSKYNRIHNQTFYPLREDKMQLLVDFLFDKNIVEPKYSFKCTKCSLINVSSTISKEEYENFKKMFSLTEEEINKMSYDDYLKYMRSNSINLNCEHCKNDIYIETLESLNENTLIRFLKVIVEPNHDYDFIDELEKGYLN